MSGIGIHTDSKSKKTQVYCHCSQRRGQSPSHTGAEWRHRLADIIRESTSDFDLMPSCCAHTVRASVKVSVEVVLLAEFVRERDAGEQLAPFTLDWVDIEEHHEA